MISVPRSSIPSGSRTRSKLDARRGRMKAWIVGVQGPARRTVSPTRTTGVMLPPTRTISSASCLGLTRSGSSPPTIHYAAVRDPEESVLVLDHEIRAADRPGQLRLLPRELEA